VLNWRLRRCAAFGSLSLNDLHLCTEMTKLSELRCDQRVVLRVIDHRDVVGEFGIEPDGQNILRERHRMGFEKIASGKRARAANGLEQIAPKRIEVCVRGDWNGRRLGCG